MGQDITLPHVGTEIKTNDNIGTKIKINPHIGIELKTNPLIGTEIKIKGYIGTAWIGIYTGILFVLGSLTICIFRSKICKLTNSLTGKMRLKKTTDLQEVALNLKR
jgi:hypothetical protein